MVDFCRQLHDDVSSHLEAWVHWNDGTLLLEINENDRSACDKAFSARRKQLVNRLRVLKKLIEKEYDPTGEPNRHF